MTAWMLGLGILVSLQPGAGAPKLTLAEAETIALENAFDVRVARSGLVRADGLVRAARGATGLQFSVGGQYQRFDQPIITFAGSSPASLIDQKTATASVSMLIDVAGVFRKGVDAAREQREAASQSLTAAQNEIRATVRTAYYNVLAAGWGVTIREEALKTTQARLDNARKVFEVGSLARFDVLRLETEVARAQADVIDAQNALALVKSALNNAMGRPIETPFDAVDVESMVPSASEGELVQLAMTKRPEIAAAEAGVRALGRVKETEERGLKPSLALSGQYTRTIDALRGQRVNQVVGVASLTIPLYDSGITRARVRAAQEDQTQARVRLEQLRLGITLQVRQAWLRLKNAREQLDVANKLVDLQAEALRLAEVRFNEGEGILLDVNQAQTDLTAARVSQNNARYQLLAAIAELKLAAGVDDLTAPTAAPDASN